MLKSENTDYTYILQGGGAKLSAFGDGFSLLGKLKSLLCRHSEDEVRRISLNKRSFAYALDDNVTGGSLCKDDMRRHCEELATKQSIDRGQALPSAMTCDWQDTQKPVIAHSVARSLFLDCFAYARNDGRKKAAFTLAEVLITLGVIGVVAAMTLPGLVNKYQEKAWLTQFKVTYSVLSQAYLRAYQENGVIKNWNLPLDNKAESARIVADNLLPYLNLAQDWKQNSNYSSHNLPMHYLGLNGIKIATGFNGWESAHYVFALANGATVGIFDFLLDEVDNKLRVLLYVDTNGGNGPNQFGKDFFIIALNTKKGYPIITGYDPWNSTQNGCSTTKTVAWYSGGACATWVIATGNMDYLHRELTAEEWSEIIKAGDIKEE